MRYRNRVDPATRSKDARRSLRICALLGASLLAASGLTAQSRQLGDLYARESYRLLEEHPEEAIERAEVALSYDRENADALHVLAMVDALEQATRYRAISRLEQAIEFGRFRHTSQREARLLLADLLLNAGEYVASLEIIEPVLAGDALDPDALQLSARALKRSGDTAAAREVAREADMLYPDDPRFFRILLDMDDAPGFEELRRIETNPMPDDRHWYALLLHYAGVATTESERERAVRLFLEHGGSDPAIFLYAQHLDDEERIERFFEHEGDRDIGLVQEMYAKVGDTGRRLLRERFDRFSGTLIRDRERRGLAEERFVFERGRLARWEIDERVDGRPEWIIEFTTGDGKPLSVLRRTDSLSGSQAVELTYRRYPEVERATVGDERLFLRPRSFEFPILDQDSPWFEEPHSVFFPFSLEPPPFEPERDRLSMNSYLVQQMKEGRVAASVRLRDGIPILESRDSLGDGRVDWVLYYEEGALRRALRDPVGDGRFDVFEEYDEGVLSWIGYDSNRDGIYDFIESYEDGRLAEWDYDGDGTVDVRYESFVDETTRTRFLRFLDPPVELRINRIWTAPIPIQ